MRRRGSLSVLSGRFATIRPGRAAQVRFQPLGMTLTRGTAFGLTTEVVAVTDAGLLGIVARVGVRSGPPIRLASSGLQWR